MDRGNKMAYEHDKTTRKPDYQPLHPLVKWGLPAGIWWFIVVILPPFMFRYTLFRDGIQLLVFTGAMGLWHIIAVLMFLVHKMQTSIKVGVFVLAVVQDLAWTGIMLWLILYMSFLI